MSAYPRGRQFGTPALPHKWRFFMQCTNEHLCTEATYPYESWAWGGPGCPCFKGPAPCKIRIFFFPVMPALRFFFPLGDPRTQQHPAVSADGLRPGNSSPGHATPFQGRKNMVFQLEKKVYKQLPWFFSKSYRSSIMTSEGKYRAAKAADATHFLKDVKDKERLWS